MRWVHTYSVRCGVDEIYFSVTETKHWSEQWIIISIKRNATYGNYIHKSNSEEKKMNEMPYRVLFEISALVRYLCVCLCFILYSTTIRIFMAEAICLPSDNNYMQAYTAYMFVTLVELNKINDTMTMSSNFVMLLCIIVQSNHRLADRITDMRKIWKIFILFHLSATASHNLTCHRISYSDTHSPQFFII